MKSTVQVLNKPFQIFLVTGAGLTAALVSDGAGDVIAWLCLAYVVSIALCSGFGRKPGAACAANGPGGRLQRDPGPSPFEQLDAAVRNDVHSD